MQKKHLIKFSNYLRFNSNKNLWKLKQKKLRGPLSAAWVEWHYSRNGAWGAGSFKKSGFESQRSAWRHRRLMGGTNWPTHTSAVKTAKQSGLGHLGGETGVSPFFFPSLTRWGFREWTRGSQWRWDLPTTNHVLLCLVIEDLTEQY